MSSHSFLLCQSMIVLLLRMELDALQNGHSGDWVAASWYSRGHEMHLVAPRQLENKSSMPQACEGLWVCSSQLCALRNVGAWTLPGLESMGGEQVVSYYTLKKITCCGSKRSFYWRLWKVFLFGDHLSHTTKLDRFSLGNALLNIYLCMTTKEWGWWIENDSTMTMGCDDGMMTKKGCQKDADGTKTAWR